MNVLSLFNGMSFGYMALESIGIDVKKYYSSEIDRYANEVSSTLFPGIVQLGDVKDWREWDVDFGSIDLLLAGFPCQAWSMAGKKEGDKDPRGALVHDLVDIWSEIRGINPNIRFMFENVKMKPDFLHYINNLFGVAPIEIDSALVSAQKRKRYYWTNIKDVCQPEDKKISLSSILEDLKDDCVGVSVRDESKCVRVGGRNSPFGSKQEWDSPYQKINRKGEVKTSQEKSSTLTVGGKSGGNHSDMDIIHTPEYTRRYSVTECARLQCVPEEYISKIKRINISNSQLYKMIANGWTHDVITHIFKGLR